jgi:glycosyltransferase 2 family protein
MSDPAATQPARPQAAPKPHRLLPVVLVGLMAILAYLVLSLVVGWGTTLKAVLSLGPVKWAALLGLSLVNYGLRFARWHAYLRALGANVPVVQNLLIYVAGFAFTVTPGKAGEAVRSVYLRGSGVPWSSGLAALAAERVLDLAAVALLATLALASFADYVLAAVIVGVCIGALLFILVHHRVSEKLLALWPESERWPNLKHGLQQMLARSRRLLLPRRLVFGLALGLVAWSAEGLGFYFLVVWLSADTEAFAAIGIYAASMLAGALSFLPGGLGGAEAAMVGLLLASGTALGTATTATMICRAVTLWFAVVLGMASVAALAALQKRQQLRN